ncbi:MAG: HEAT repeat domain-containing protein [Terriglobia bacterium]|jgi:hypothetical protein
MDFHCLLGKHKWGGCKCTACGKTRREGHDWDKDCKKCVRCGAIGYGEGHKWNGGDCKKCGMTLTTALKDKNWFVAKEAAEWLGYLGDPKAIESLAAALEWEGDDRWRSVYVGIAAAEALYKLGDARGVSYLMDCLRADSLYVRVDARKALEALGKFPNV